MSDYTFPSQVNYTEQAGSLPKDVKCLNICTQPSNGQSFGPSSQIYLDLVSGRGYLDPQSVYISYTLSLTNAAATQMIGTPVYTPFNRVAVDIGSQQIDQISSYNVVMNTLTNCNMSVAEKYGVQSAYGYNDNTTVPSLEQLDGRLCAINEVISLSAPLLTVISASEKLWPLWSMGSVRLTLTLEAISNMFNSTVAVPTNYVMSNIQLRYKVIDFGNEVNQAVRAANPNGLVIKTQSFASGSQVLQGGSNGSFNLLYNLKYSSIKALVAVNGNGAAASNRQYDSIDLCSTTTGTDYQFSVGGEVFPPTAISTRNNKAGALMELRSCFGSIFDKSNASSINSVEFNWVGGTAAATTYQAMGKLYIGTSTEKMVNSESLLSGISSTDTPIEYKINTSASIGANNSTVTLIACYDALIVVDTETKQVQIKT